MGNLYLIPNLIGDTDVADVLPAKLPALTEQLRHFIVENVRTARRYLRKLSQSIDIEQLTFYELNKHTDMTCISSYLDVCVSGVDMGLLSEAGLPCVADPGAVIVRMAHQRNIRVIPLAGPSSLFMALMASGLNGQNFAFNGYLPVDEQQKINTIKKLEQKSLHEHQSQLFMDTPYRNNKLFDTLISTLHNNTELCVASNISCHNEFIKTMKIADWKKIKLDLNKKPCIFVI